MSNYHKLNIHQYNDGDVLLEFEDWLSGRDWRVEIQGDSFLAWEPGFYSPVRRDISELPDFLKRLAKWLKENR